MKNLLGTLLFLIVSFLTVGFAQAQADVQQRVERYLFSNYNANKSALRENERIIRILEENFDKYLESLDKDTKAVVKGQDKEVNQYLSQVEKVRDIQLLTRMVEEAKLKYRVSLDKYVNNGLSTPQDALECRKIIVMKLAEHELVQQKQQKLIALLKDDHSRTEFIKSVLSKGKVKEDADLKTFVQNVDNEVFNYEL